MMKRSVVMIAVSLLLGAASQQSRAGIINFEDIPAPVGLSTLDASETSGGYLFTSPYNHMHRDNQSPGFADSGSTNVLMHDNAGSLPGNFMTMTQLGGGTFSINRVLLSEGFIGLQATSVDVLGNIFGGGTVTTNFVLDGINDSVGGVADFQPFSFTAAWTNLTSVVFTGVGGVAGEHAWSIDDITVNETADTPEPATLTLFGIGLAALGLSRRRKKAIS